MICEVGVPQESVLHGSTAVFAARRTCQRSQTSLLIFASVTHSIYTDDTQLCISLIAVRLLGAVTHWTACRWIKSAWSQYKIYSRYCVYYPYVAQGWHSVMRRMSSGMARLCNLYWWSFISYIFSSQILKTYLYGKPFRHWLSGPVPNCDSSICFDCHTFREKLHNNMKL